MQAFKHIATKSALYYSLRPPFPDSLPGVEVRDAGLEPLTESLPFRLLVSAGNEPARLLI